MLSLGMSPLTRGLWSGRGWGGKQKNLTSGETPDRHTSAIFQMHKMDTLTRSQNPVN